MRGPIYLSTVGMILFYLLAGTAIVSETTVAFTPETEEAQCKVYIPNAFSPNGDGINDLFMPASNCSFQDYEMRIFDRWGTLIYQTKNASDGWDGNYRGEEAESTAYVYYIRYQAVPTDTLNQTFPEIATGNFALLR